MAIYTTERVIDVHHWSEALFSFTTTRGSGLRFENGQFVMVGLASADAASGKITRAYSIASANHEDHLAFYSIKVPNGPLTSRLQHIEPGSPLLVSTKPTGTLVVRDLKPGRRLFLMATGTGVAPFLAIIKDPATYEAFEEVYLVRGASTVAGLAYAESVLDRLRHDEFLGDLVRVGLIDHPSVTREAYRNRGRVTDLLESGELHRRLAIGPLDRSSDRFMICGNMRMCADMVRLLEARGLVGSPRVGVPGDFVIERAFVDATAVPASAAVAEFG